MKTQYIRLFLSVSIHDFFYKKINIPLTFMTYLVVYIHYTVVTTFFQRTLTSGHAKLASICIFIFIVEKTFFFILYLTLKSNIKYAKQKVYHTRKKTSLFMLIMKAHKEFISGAIFSHFIFVSGSEKNTSTSA
jgi:hypothetical protein